MTIVKSERWMIYCGQISYNKYLGYGKLKTIFSS